MPYVPYVGLAIAAFAIVRYPWRRASAHQLALGVFAAAAVSFLLVHSTGRGTPFGDFDKAYYPAGRLVLTDPGRLYNCANDDGLCFVNVPIVALAFVPFSVLPRTAAHAVFALLGIAAIVFAGVLLWRVAGATDRRGRDAVLALVLLNGPLYYSFRLGNLTHIVLAMLALAVFWLIRARDGRAGALIGIAAVLKPPLFLWLMLFAARRRWRAMASMTAAALSIGVASVLLFGLGLHLDWARQFVAATAAKPVGAYNVQSLSGFLVRLGRGGTLVNWHGVDVATGFYAARLGLALAVTAVALVAGRPTAGGRTRAAELSDCAIVLCTMLAISPISWTHYYCFLLIPLAGLATGALEVPAGRAGTTAVAAAGLMVSLPVMLWIPSTPLAGAIVARILISHYLFGALLLLTGLAVRTIAIRTRARAPVLEVASTSALVLPPARTA